MTLSFILQDKFAEAHWQARVQKVAWYANRLRAMSTPEIAHRLYERAKWAIDRRRTFAWHDFDMGDGDVPGLPLVSLCGSDMGSLEAQWAKAASAFKSGELELLGSDYAQINEPTDWHLDPVTGLHWPANRFCFDVPFRHDHSIGDVKYVWERNRLQYLQPVAASSCLRKDASLQTACINEIESWMSGNQPFTGVAWAAGIEVALRIVSILTVTSFLNTEALKPNVRRLLRQCLAAHGYWLARYPSRFSSANNHLIAEAGALLILGTVWPELPQSRKYERYGRRTLEREVERQIHDDGVGAEQSPTYTAFTLEWYLLAAWVAEQSGRPLSRRVSDRLTRAAEHLRWITDEGGSQPRIGDDDEGRVIGSGFDERDYVSSVLDCLSAHLRKPELAPPKTCPRLRNLFFGTPKASGAGPSGVRTFESGGYTVIRREIGEHNVMLAIDHGPLGHLSIAAHGHADALALWLHVDDMPVLVDAGTYLYQSGGAWRDAFRGTPAHNTLTLDRMDSSTISGPFNWSRKAKARLLRDPSANDVECLAAAAHDGYLRQFGVEHARRILSSDCGFKVIDRLAGALTGAAFAEIAYLVHPDLTARIEGDAVTILRNGKPLLGVRGKGLDVTIHKGESEPPRGWYSPEFGEKVPAQQIVFRFQAEASRDFQTELSLL